MTNQHTILVVDDEPDIRELLQITLGRMGLNACLAENLGEAKRQLSKKTFQLCLTDMRLPDGDGLELVQHIQRHHPHMPVAVISAHGNLDTAVKAMKYGAFDFISKPIDLANLRQLITSALAIELKPVQERRMRHILLGESPAMWDLRGKISRVARSQAPIYISGESGSGKEMVARLVHQQSPRYDQPFVPVNCGAIPPELMESEFFGHKKGSFTGANIDKIGLFQAADGGTLFLDEIADLPPNLQVKLLRAIQEKKVRPVGEQREIPVDVRLLSATHKNLGKMVQDGDFRQDLYYRINVIELQIPPLRERPEDIPQLAEHMLAKLTGARAGQQTPKISADALRSLQGYPFPGNVRELENILERALALYEGNCIETHDLNLPTTTWEQPQTNETPPVPPQRPAQNIASAYDPALAPLESYLEDIEKQAIVAALERNRWNKTATAQELGMTFRSLRYRMKKLALD